MSNPQKSYNIDPYYDDFDEDKNFHQILFRPGLSVQSRELTQLQTIIRDQIKKFGDHVFQQGSIVIPGNSFVDYSGTSIKLQDEYLGTPIDVSLFLDKIIVGATTGVRAVVRAVAAITDSDPNTIIVNYLQAGNNGQSIFDEDEEIYVEENISIKALLATDPYSESTMVFINDGVYYVNGNFVKVLKQTLVLEKYTSSPNCHVLLQIIESIVTPDDDQTLLDPAQGEPNYAAPGSDRLKIELKLTSLPIGSEISDDYVEIMRFEEGTLVYHAVNAKYSELEKSLARRTYDESGDYIVSGFNPSLIEHLKQTKTKGLYLAPKGDKNKFVLKLTSGKAYINGFEKEQIATTNISIDKARTPDHIKYKESAVTPSFGQAIYITDLVKMPNISNHETVNLYNSSNTAEASAVNIGTAKTYCIDYKEGQNIYTLYVYDVKFNSPSYTYQDIGGIRFSGSGSAKVLQKLTIPNATKQFTFNEVLVVSGSNRSGLVHYHDLTTSVLYIYKNSSTMVTAKVGDTITGYTSTAQSSVTEKLTIDVKGEQSSPIIPLPLSPLYTIRDSNGDPDIVYRAYKYFTITTDSSGNGSVNIDNGRLDAITPSTVIATWSGGLVSLSLIGMSATGTTLTITGGPLNAVISVQASITKTDLTEKTKTLLTNVDSSLTLTGSGSRYVTLSKADIYELTSVISSVDGNVTDRFKLDNGQTNYYYGLGKIILNGVEPGGTLTVTYKYFQHSASGDYFSVDSYRNSGITSSTALDFLSYVPTYYSQTDSKYYDLSACLDFRKIIGTAGDAVINDSSITATFGYYVSRKDIYGMNTSGDIVYITGIPEEIPEYPKTPDDTVIFGSLNIPAWTADIKAVTIKEENIRRYTMKDINKLASRVDNLENYVTLNALETSTDKMDVIDPVTGLSRYKMGFLVDDFSSAKSPGDFYNYKFAAEYSGGTLMPPKEWVQSDLFFDSVSSSHYQVSGDVITLPYTETVFISQPYSTKITNVNPFLVIAWVGNMTLDPNVDSWVETEYLPDIINTVTNTITNTIRVSAPAPAPAPAVTTAPAPAVQTPSPVPAPAPTPAPTPTVTIQATSMTPYPPTKTPALAKPPTNHKTPALVGLDAVSNFNGSTSGDNWRTTGGSGSNTWVWTESGGG